MIDLGKFKTGEKPLPTPVQFLDGANNPLNITGWTARYVIRSFDATASTERTSVAITDAATGKVAVTWDPLDFATAGTFVVEVWVGNLNNRLASRTITYTVETAVGPAPAI